MLLFTFIILLTNYNNVGEAADILGLFHAPSPSHLILAEPLFKALTSKGHRVTVVSAYPLKIALENYRDIVLEEIIPFKDQYVAPMMSINCSVMDKFKALATMPALSELVLSSEKIQKLKSEHFDLVIQNIILTDPLLGLAHHFKAPVVGFGTIESNIFTNQYVGNPIPLSYLPTVATTFPTTGMNFRDRVLNVFSATLLTLIFNSVYNHLSSQVYNKHFPDGPPLDDLKMNVSLVFVNAHYSIESPRPYVPNLIQVGGIQIEEPKQLPKDLQQYLDNAKDGAVLFSLGSNFNIVNLGDDTVTSILKTLGRLKMKVLLKSDGDLKDVPPNIKISKWLPQSDILAHPNVKLFISHGGLLSTTEAVYHAVPILGIPLFGDQQQNVFTAASNGYAVQLTPHELTEETFSKAIDEILNNPKYRENIELRSSLLRDQPMKPLDLAVFWVEHVLKHKGATHLKNMGANLPWYQYHLIDVLTFIAAIILLISYIGFVILRKIVRYVIRRKTISKKKHD